MDSKPRITENTESESADGGERRLLYREIPSLNRVNIKRMEWSPRKSSEDLLEELYSKQ